MSLYQAKPLASRVISGKTLVYSREEEAVFELNVVGAEVWRCLEKPKTTDEVIEEIKVKFNSLPSYKKLTKDVKELIADLLDNQLIVEVEE